MSEIKSQLSEKNTTVSKMEDILRQKQDTNPERLRKISSVSTDTSTSSSDSLDLNNNSNRHSTAIQHKSSNKTQPTSSKTHLNIQPIERDSGLVDVNKTSLDITRSSGIGGGSMLSIQTTQTLKPTASKHSMTHISENRENTYNPETSTASKSEATTNSTNNNEQSASYPTVKLRQKRQGISATPIQDKSKIILPKRNSKIALDPETIEKVYTAFTENDFLKMQDDDNLQTMSKCVEGPISIKSGTKIIQEGDNGDGLFILVDGTVEISKKGNLLREISTSKADKGIVIGELAILYNTKRTASVIATTVCQAYYIDRVSFQAISIESGQNKINEIKNFLKKVALFKNFPERKLMKLIDAFEVEEFDKNTFIIRQNSPGDTFYIIAEGEVEIKGGNIRKSANVDLVFFRAQGLYKIMIS